LEASIAGITSTVETHTGHLEAIKEKVSAPLPVAEPTDLSGLEGSIKEVTSSLDAQKATL